MILKVTSGSIKKLAKYGVDIHQYFFYFVGWDHGGRVNWGLELTAPDPAAPLSFMRLRSFGARSALEISDALPKLRKEGAEEFVIDLRGNGGTARLHEISLDHIGSHWLESERLLLDAIG